MSACENQLPLINALADGELDAANSLALEQHLKTCAGCARAFADLQKVRKVLASEGVAHRAPEALRSRIAEALAAETATPARAAPRLPGWRSGWTGFGLAAAASLAVAVFAGQAYRTQLADELVSDHVRSMLADHLTDVATSDRHTVKPWFDGKAPFAPAVLDLADKGYPLVGGRLDYVRGQRAAALVFHRRLHVINVFVWPTGGGDALAGDTERQGYNLVRWSSGGLNYWAVSDLDRTELEEFRALYLAAMKT